MSEAGVEACYFGPEERPLFGWLHQAAGGAPQIGLVICNPFGYEEICAHRSLKHFARAAAESGFPALRFDYDGTGDSAGSELDPDRVSAWIASIEAAIAHIRSVTGVRQVALLGVRLGALLAMLAAERSRDLAGVIAIAPVVRGRSMLRELKALQIAMREAPDAPPADGLEEYAGFPMTAATAAALSQVDLGKSLQTPPARVLVLDRNDRPKSADLIAALERGGTKLEAHSLPGFVEMTLDAHEAVVPTEMIARTVEWLRSLPPPETPQPLARESLARATATFASAAPGGASVVEEALFVDRLLFAITTRPASGPEPKRAVLLLNAGAVHHVGPNRWYVTLARRLATLGFVVVRADLSGIGDSRTRPDAAENVVYSNCAVDDIGLLLRFVRETYRIDDLHALGLCSGAYHSLKSALRERYDGILVINPLTFFWKEGMSLEYPDYQVSSEALRYRATALRLTSWLKLVRGRVDLRELRRVLAKRLLSVMRSRARNIARWLRLSLHEDLGNELLQLSRRRTAMSFIFAQTDPGLDMLKMQGGSAVSSLARRGMLSIDVVTGANHTFTARESRERLTEVVLGKLAGSGT